MSLAVSVRSSSRDLPPVAAARGCRLKMVENITLVSFCAQVMSAFWCSPKTSGEALTGSEVRHGAPVPRVGHAPAVIHLGGERRDHFVRRLLVLINQHLRLLQAHIPVALGKLVRDVPAERAKLAALANHSVEEQQPEHDLAPDVGFRSGLEALGRHGSDGGAQDAHRELWRGHRCEPEAIRRVRLLRVNVLHFLFERRKPRDEEVAVHQQNPAALIFALLDHALGLWALPLPKRDEVEPVGHVALLGVGEQPLDRVGARRENEDERHRHVGVGEGGVQVKGRRLDEAPAQLLLHKQLDRRYALVRPDAAQNQQPLEAFEHVLPRRRQRRCLRRNGVVQRTPLVQVVGKMLVDALEARELREVDDLEPHVVFEPRAARQQKPPLLAFHLACARQDLNAEQEGEHQLVLLEDGPADVGVERVGDLVVEQRDPRVDVVRLLGVCDAEQEERAEPGERVLVHRVDEREVGDAKVEDGAAHGDGDVLGAERVNLGLGHLRLGHGRHDLLRGGLGDGQRVDQLGVVEDVSLRVGEHVQDLVLQLLQLALVVGRLDYELVFFLGEVGPLGLNSGDKQLVLQPVGRDVRVGDHRGEGEAEVGVERDHRVAQLDHERAVGVLVGLVREDWLEERVEDFEDILKQHGLPDADAHLERLLDLLGRVRRLDCLQVRLGLRVFEEAVRLPLRVDHQRPTLRH
eukprot:4711458-Pleurochrysis_carterae.AAC.2